LNIEYSYRKCSASSFSIFKNEFDVLSQWEKLSKVCYTALWYFDLFLGHHFKI